MADFPAGLPSPLIESYSYGLGPRFTRLAMSDGRPRYRRLDGTATEQAQVVWMLDGWDFSIFKDWFYRVINQNDWFWMYVATGVGARDINGHDLGEHFPERRRCHFVSMWQAQHIQDGMNVWRVSANIEMEFVAPRQEFPRPPRP